MYSHGTWPLRNADGWHRRLPRRGKRADPDADAWIRFLDEQGSHLSVLYATPGLDRLETFAEAHCLEHTFSQMLQMTSMMFQGVFDEFPRLRIAFLEAGLGWVPFMIDRLDEDFEKFGSRAPKLKRRPSEHLRS